ncbi:MAG: hypothetical protein KatS3mg096_658 [Candidatus Parcubacteria bacterium]|nr:MAG: hypothetical protein KatS3mg096_658 [Candidatus Parcubacteria bacterium]
MRNVYYFKFIKNAYYFTVLEIKNTGENKDTKEFFNFKLYKFVCTIEEFKKIIQQRKIKFKWIEVYTFNDNEDFELFDRVYSIEELNSIEPINKQ